MGTGLSQKPALRSVVDLGDQVSEMVMRRLKGRTVERGEFRLGDDGGERTYVLYFQDGAMVEAFHPKHVGRVWTAAHTDVTDDVASQVLGAHAGYVVREASFKHHEDVGVRAYCIEWVGGAHLSFAHPHPKSGLGADFRFSFLPDEENEMQRELGRRRRLLGNVRKVA